METKSAHECEAHYYTFYYKSSTNKCPTQEDLIVQRSENGQIRINTERAEESEGRAKEYVSKAFSEDEEKKETIIEDSKISTQKCK